MICTCVCAVCLEFWRSKGLQIRAMDNAQVAVIDGMLERVGFLSLDWINAHHFHRTYRLN